MVAYFRFDVPIDADLNEILNVLVQSGTLSTSGLSSAHDGLLRRSDNRLYMFDGAELAWKLVATDSDHLGGETLAWVRDRANATGTQDAATITGLGPVIQATRLDQFAAPNTDVDLGSQKIVSLADGVADSDGVNKGQLNAAVAAAVAGLAIRGPADVATTANITLSGTQTIDGYAAQVGDIVLVKNQTTNTQNGLYTVAAGAWSRTSDSDAGGELKGGVIVPVDRGTNHADQMFMLLTNGDITPGTSAIVWGQFGGGTSYSAGAGLSLTGNTFDIGAGDGISVLADSIAVDSDSVPFKASGTVPSGSATVSITHPLNTLAVAAHVFDTNGEVGVGKKATDTTHFELTFGSAPSTDQYTYLLIG